ncbi:MAG TPA: NIPSNAP family protein [Cyclobacteriaceae bacterium]|nr:NIPSNAP family protein [Cyclobacteriaceae bacterium]
MKYTLLVFAVLAAASITSSYAQSSGRQIYELRVYELTMGSLGHMENYLGKALIPALNRSGVKNVGAFRETGKNEPPKIYVLIPYASMADYARVRKALERDEAYQSDSEAYRKLPKAVYFRYKSSLLEAFAGLPSLVVPPSGERIFELRIYEGYSDDAVSRKVKMFNEGEIDIFRNTGLNAVFFGETLSGPDMPSLQYMLTFRDMEERDKNWQAFIAHPDWAKMSKDPQYANTVSKIIRVFLEPMAFSQI